MTASDVAAKYPAILGGKQREKGDNSEPAEIKILNDRYTPAEGIGTRGRMNNG